MPPMHRDRFRWLLPTLLLAWGGAQAAGITIYRCTDAQGRLTLRDTPCRKGERQELREMLQPQDPPARALLPSTAPAAPAPAPAAPPAATRVVLMTAPRPLYECMTADGERYTSDSDAGNPRWVPLWTLGYPVYGHGHRQLDPRRGGLPVVATPRTLDGRLPGRLVFDSVGRPPPQPPGDRPGAPARPPPAISGVGYASSALVRDECHALPPQEACARLRDRRYELDRRYNSALQSERDAITREQRGIDARLSAECEAP